MCSVFSAGVSSCKNILQLSVDGVYPEKSPGAPSELASYWSMFLTETSDWLSHPPSEYNLSPFSECCKGIHINIEEDQTIPKFAKFKILLSPIYVDKIRGQCSGHVMFTVYRCCYLSVILAGCVSVSAVWMKLACLLSIRSRLLDCNGEMKTD